jgi:hypothetical protein
MRIICENSPKILIDSVDFYDMVQDINYFGKIKKNVTNKNVAYCVDENHILHLKFTVWKYNKIYFKKNLIN